MHILFSKSDFCLHFLKGMCAIWAAMKLILNPFIIYVDTAYQT